MKKVLFLVSLSILLLPSLVLAQIVVTPPSNNGSNANQFQPTPSATQASSGAGAGSCGTISNNGLAGVVACIIGILNVAIYLMISAAVVLTAYGAFKMIYSEEGRASGRETVVYGIIGLFVMVSIWGFVNILDRTFRLSGQQPVTPPQIRIPTI